MAIPLFGAERPDLRECPAAQVIARFAANVAPYVRTVPLPNTREKFYRRLEARVTLDPPGSAFTRTSATPAYPGQAGYRPLPNSVGYERAE